MEKMIKSLRGAVESLTETFPHKIEFDGPAKTTKTTFKKTEKKWRLGEAHFGPQGFLTDGAHYAVDENARWAMTESAAYFKSDADAVMMFFLLVQLKN